MLSAESLASIESEGRRLGLTARRDPDRPVPQYPGWSLSDLVSHTASIHGRTVAICADLPSDRISAPRLPDGADPLDWYDETLELMLAALREADSTSPCWAFGPEQTLGFWENRMVIETGLHRWDAYQAFAEEDRLTDHVAVTGMDEFGGMWLARTGALPTLRLVADDHGGSWTIGEGPPQETIAGSVSDLYLRLMSRPSPVVLPEEWATAVDALEPPPKR